MAKNILDLDALREFTEVKLGGKTWKVALFSSVQGYEWIEIRDNPELSEDEKGKALCEIIAERFRIYQPDFPVNLILELAGNTNRPASASGLVALTALLMGVSLKEAQAMAKEQEKLAKLSEDKGNDPQSGSPA